MERKAFICRVYQ